MVTHTKSVQERLCPWGLRGYVTFPCSGFIQSCPGTGKFAPRRWYTVCKYRHYESQHALGTFLQREQLFILEIEPKEGNSGGFSTTDRACERTYKRKTTKNLKHLICYKKKSNNRKWSTAAYQIFCRRGQVRSKGWQPMPRRGRDTRLNPYRSCLYSNPSLTSAKTACCLTPNSKCRPLGGDSQREHVGGLR